MTINRSSVYVPQGKFEVSDNPDIYITAVLGSCVAACLWDDVVRVGGMNHLLLPPAQDIEAGDGIHLMELLINALLKHGAKKDRLKVKLFGGGRMIDGMSDIGGRNAAFAREFFRYEGLDVVAESLGGEHARRIQFWPCSGKARQRFVPAYRVETNAPEPTSHSAGEIDLF